MARVDSALTLRGVLAGARALRSLAGVAHSATEDLLHRGGRGQGSQAGEKGGKAQMHGRVQQALSSAQFKIRASPKISKAIGRSLILYVAMASSALRFGRKA